MFAIPSTQSISGLVAECIVAIDVTRARFPADANLPASSHAGGSGEQGAGHNPAEVSRKLRPLGQNCLGSCARPANSRHKMEQNHADSNRERGEHPCRAKIGAGIFTPGCPALSAAERRNTNPRTSKARKRSKEKEKWRTRVRRVFRFFLRGGGGVVGRTLSSLISRATPPNAKGIYVRNSKHSEHQWSSGRMHRCHRCDPGSIPG